MTMLCFALWPMQPAGSCWTGCARGTARRFCELCQGLDMTRQAVAKHLAVLEKANLVSWKRQGREKLHFINPAPINQIAERGRWRRGTPLTVSGLRWRSSTAATTRL
jgi:DNA-binding transcriptional ArsR family regulator